MSDRVPGPKPGPASGVPDEEDTAGGEPATHETPPGAALHPIPSGESFVFARWEEITSSQAPWWTRPTGVGLRLRLAELSELAEARSAGGIARQAISRLIGEAQRVLFDADGYFARRFKVASDDIRRSLRDDAAETWVPAASGPSAAAAALDLINSSDYISNLVHDLAADAAAIGTITSSGDAALAFTRLETMVEL